MCIIKKIKKEFKKLITSIKMYIKKFLMKSTYKKY